MIFAIVFDSFPVSEVTGLGWAELPCPAPIGLISRIAKEELAGEAGGSLPNPTHHCFRDIYDVSLHINQTKHSPSDDQWAQLIFDKWRNLQQQYMQTLDAEISNDAPIHSTEVLYKPAQLATMLFFSLLDGSVNDQWPNRATRNKLAGDLKLALMGAGDVTWLQAAPSAFLWICLTGAAVSEDSQTRGWFYFRQGSMARALNVDDASLIQDAWSYFYWLRQIARQRV